MTTRNLTLGPPMERLRTRTLLGLRFRDQAYGTPVDSGLDVVAVPQDRWAPWVRAGRTRSGAYAFHDLPGLRAIELFARGPEAATPLRFTIVVADRLGRYLPAAFGLELPLAGGMGSPPNDGSLVDAYLFTAPSRAPDPGLAMIRAELWSQELSGPASYAVLRVDVGSRHGIGVADRRGRVLAAVPYPAADLLRIGSPPGRGAGGAPQTWPVRVQAHHARDITEHPATSARLPWPWHGLPSTRVILEDQPLGPFVATGGDWTGELKQGETLLLDGDAASRVWIRSGTLSS